MTGSQDYTQYFTCRRCPCCGKLVKGASNYPNYPQFPVKIYCGATGDEQKVDLAQITAQQKQMEGVVMNELVKLHAISTWQKALKAIILILRGRAVKIAEFIPAKEYYKRNERNVSDG